jgi:hypothetical protein
VHHAFYLYPTGNVGYDYYIGIRFRDMANAFFAITFVEDGGKLSSSFGSLHFSVVKPA